MRKTIKCFLCVAVCIAVILFAREAVAKNEITVRIFSKYAVKKAVLTGKIILQSGNRRGAELFKSCAFTTHVQKVKAHCGKKSFYASMFHVNNAGGSYLSVSALNMKRFYRGAFIVYAENGKLVLINKISVEDYLLGILGAEMPFSSIEALKAQSVVSRTWLYANKNNHKHYDFCDLTHCQVYKGVAAESATVKRAVLETKALILTSAGNHLPAQVFYHSTCGGKTTNRIAEKTVPSLSAVDDPYCAHSPHAAWEFFILKKKLNAVFHKTITNISVAKRDASGRAVVIVIKSNGSESQISAQFFYHALGKAIGWNKLKSTWFDVTSTQEAFVFKGKGLGHGAGLCQWGALGMAKQGKNYIDILKHYFPKLQCTHAVKN